jgi:D-amino-acid dehydrogenase
MKSVCIIGAGIVGCTTAYQLAREGLRVHLVDAEPQAGSMTSYANGAQLSYSYVEPFASPATLKALPGMLLTRRSPVRFRLRADWRQWLWVLQFVAACSERRARTGTEQLLRLAQLSRRTLEGWMREEDWHFLFSRNGKLVLCPDAQVLKRQEAQVRLQAGFGCRQEVLTAEDCIRREPALARGERSFAGGVWTEDECVADPYLLCQELVRSIRRSGGTVSFGTRVESFRKEKERFVAAMTATGAIEADAFVLCAGPLGAKLASTIGVTLPIYPIKGYSITVPFTAGQADRPSASVTDLARKTVLAPLGDRLRVAAMAEVGECGFDVAPDKVEQMLETVRRTYPGLCDLSAPLPWAGLRPATPDSLPIVRRISGTNMFINGGHGALGLTLAAGSAVTLSRLMANSP